MTVDISIPAPVTPGVATPYVLEVLAPFNAAGIFKVCSFEIVSIGRDMPCLNKDAIKPTYSTREAGGTTADGATLDLGKGCGACTDPEGDRGSPLKNHKTIVF